MTERPGLLRRRHAEPSDGPSTSADIQKTAATERDAAPKPSGVGVLACTLVAISIAALLYAVPLRIDWSLLKEADQLEHGQLGNRVYDTDDDFVTPRDNVTVQKSLDSAVMGAFLADAASLGLQG